VRALVLSNLYPPAAMGGYEMSCRDVVDRWRARGHEVTVLTTSTNLTGAVEPDAVDPHVLRTLEWYWSDHRFLRPSPIARLRLERRDQARLRVALQSARPDVVSVWHMGGMPLSLLTMLERARVPVVLNVCDDWTDYGPRADAWLDAWSARPAWVARAAAALTGVPTRLPDLDRHRSTFVSQFTLDRARERTPWRFADAAVVGSGVDTDDFPVEPVTPDREWGWRLLCVGRVEPRKGFDVAVRALAELPEATLRIVGVPDPAYGEQLHREAVELGVAERVRTQALPRTALREAYATADVVIFPSRWDEPFGLVPLEAMTQGTPVVATRRGGSAEFLRDGDNCVEVSVDDAAGVAAAVRKLAGDAELRGRLAEGGRITVARYTTDRLADTLERLHQQAAVGV